MHAYLAKSHSCRRIGASMSVSDILAISGLHAGYGAGDILKGIDAVVPRGKVVTVIGPNGSGKSTLVKTLGRAAAGAPGRIVLDGERMNELSAPKRVRAGLSYVPQEYNVFRNLTVLENLKIAHEFMSARRARNRGKVLSDELLALFRTCRESFGRLRAT
jgi:ABC-type branched-subunit amino acid transport system ATPase component